jgi:hypothetical protein
MKTYPVIQDGSDPFAFEIDHVYLSRRTIARLLEKIEGVTEVHLGGRFGSPDDVRIEFKCQGHDFIVMEPFGGNSRYWVGPKGGKDDVAAAANIGRIKADQSSQASSWLNRCRYKGQPGIQRWVGLGVIADNLINIGHALASTAER